MTDDIKCPKCGGKTKLCTRIEDGQKFYVCVDYPRCKGGVPFDKDSKFTNDVFKTIFTNKRSLPKMNNAEMHNYLMCKLNMFFSLSAAGCGIGGVCTGYPIAILAVLVGIGFALYYYWSARKLIREVRKKISHKEG